MVTRRCKPPTDRASPDRASAPFVTSIALFRAIAIVVIVAGHCFGLAGIDTSGVFARTIVNMVGGGTHFFVFISGFLFHHIAFPRYGFGPFMKQKIRFVLFPYLFLGTIAITWIVFAEPALSSRGDVTLDHAVSRMALYYWSGEFGTVFWFVPFIMFTFLLSPLHVMFVKMTPGAQVSAIAALLLVAALVHRPLSYPHASGVFQSLVYFTPVYLIGIASSMHRTAVYRALAGMEPYLLCAAVALAFLDAVSGHVGNYVKAPLAHGGLDAMLAQKLILCFFFMAWLHRFETTAGTAMNAGAVNMVAATSFAIFFIHPLWVLLIDQASEHAGFVLHDSWAGWLAIVAFIIAACVATAASAHRLWPDRSRYFIGY